MPELALISLGSNLGDRRAFLDSAVASLSRTPGISVRSVSTYRETAAIGGPDGQGAFLNAAAALATTLEPGTLLDRLNAIEAEAGRERHVRWGERTLDLDIVLYGERVIETDRLTVPHPMMAFRRFVLAPTVEITPGVVDPTTGLTVAALLANLDRRPSHVALFRRRGDGKAVFQKLVARLSAIGLSFDPEEGVGTRPPGAGGTAENLEEDLGRLGRIARELRRDRWAEAVCGNRWVVTNFWIDRMARLTPPHHVLPVPGDRSGELREQVMEPTILVLDPRIKGDETPGDFPIGGSPSLVFGWSVPTLRPEPDDPDEIVAEVVTACQATRTG